MALKVKTKKVIDMGDWDELVTETYGRKYSFQQQEGCKSRGTFAITIPCEWDCDDEMNDSIPDEINGDEMGVKFEAWLARDPKEWNGPAEDAPWVELFWERNFYPDVHCVANDLFKKGLVEKGEYVINIDW